MTVQQAMLWLCYVTGWGLLEIDQLGLSDEQLVNLAFAFKANPMIGYRDGVALHVALVACGCNCGIQFVSVYTTKPHKYVDGNHKQRAYRERLKK